MDINSRIRKLIDAKENTTYFGDIKESIKDYSECMDFYISDSDLKGALNRLYSHSGINEFTKDKSGIITNSVNGKIAEYLYDNIHIYCLDNDYYCSMISQIVNEKKNNNDKIEFLFSDLSQFFTFKNNKNFTADFVITFPSSTQFTYKDLDYEMRYRAMNPFEYYTIRSFDFINSGGIVMSILPTNMVNSTITAVQNQETPIKVIDKLNYIGYSFIYFKKV